MRETSRRRLTLFEVRNVAAAAVRRERPGLQVIAARPQHDSDYVELVVTDADSHVEPSRRILSLDRATSPDRFSVSVAASLRGSAAE